MQGDAGFRAATVSSYQALGAGVAFPYSAIKLVSPTASTLHAQSLVRHAWARGRSAPTRASGMTFVATLNLYTDGGVFANNIATVSYFLDAAGTKPAGSIVITVPSSLLGTVADPTTYASYPVVIPIVVNLTGGNIPCHGNFTVTFTDNTGANSLVGTMTLTQNNVTFSVNLGLDNQLNVSGTITVKEGGATIEATSISGPLSGTLTCNVTVLPYNWTGTGTLSLLNGSMSLKLNTGSGISSATADNAGNVTIVDADGTKDTIHDTFLAGLIAGSNDTITPPSTGGTNGTGGGGTNGTGGGGTTTPTYSTPVNLGAFTPLKINNSGQIVGITTDASQVPVFLQSATAAMQKLPGVTKPFVYPIYSTVAMNNSGQVVGFGGNLGGAYWPTPTSQPQLLSNGNSNAYAISDGDLIVGQTFDATSTPVTTAWTDPKTPVTMKSLGIYDTPLGISPDGQIVGWTYNSNSVTVSYWKSYNATPMALAIGTLGTASNNDTMTTMSINAAGQICGALQGGGAVYWPSPTSPAQTLTGYQTTSVDVDTANSINASGVIVGSAFQSSFFPQNYHAVVWKNLQVQDLNSLIPTGSGWVLVSATSINDSGVIVGTGKVTVNGTTQSAAFLLTPK